MSTKRNQDPRQHPNLGIGAFAPDNDPATTPQVRPDITRNFDTLAGQLAGVAERSGGWVKEQVHNGLQDFVSRVLYGETRTPEVEQAKERERDDDKGLDR